MTANSKFVDYIDEALEKSKETPRDSQESSPTPQFKSINSLVLSFLYSPTLTFIHDYWKNHSFDCTDFVGKVMSLLFSRVATRVSWSPLSGLKGVQPPLPFGERTRDCSPGNA